MKTKKIHVRTKRLNRSAGGDFGITVILLIFGLFMVLPMVYAISCSLKPLDEFWIFPPRFLVMKPTTKNFRDLFRIMSASWVPFTRYIFNTVFIAVVGTAGHVILSSMAAYALSKHKFPGREIIFKIIVLSLMFNAAVTAVPNFIIMSKLGWINQYKALIVPALAAPLGLYLMKQFMEQILVDSVLESARIDGASEWKILWSIVMPMVKPAWLTLIIFSVSLPGLMSIVTLVSLTSTRRADCLSCGWTNHEVTVESRQATVEPPLIALFQTEMSGALGCDAVNQ